MEKVFLYAVSKFLQQFRKVVKSQKNLEKEIKIVGKIYLILLELVV